MKIVARSTRCLEPPRTIDELLADTDPGRSQYVRTSRRQSSSRNGGRGVAEVTAVLRAQWDDSASTAVTRSSRRL